jgi:3-dehydroquinate synthase
VKRIRVHLKERSYDILIGRGLMDRAGAICRKLKLGKDAVIITNRTICAIYGRRLKASMRRAGMDAHFELVPDSEKAKSLAVLTRLMCRISAYDRKKRLFIVAFGGGVIGDLAGFVASVYKRGVPYIQMPTTLLAQVDSAIGGKVAVDLPVAKNLAGAFYQPRGVLADTEVLRSLSLRQIRNGLAETIKYGVIKDPKLFVFLEVNCKKILRGETAALEHAIARSAAIKAHIVEKDELDTKGLRAALNYGHTIGHAIEAAAGFTGRYNHGEAVAIGMVASSRMAFKMGILKKDGLGRIEALVKRCGLPVSAREVSLRRIYGAHLHDKKFIRGRNRFVLPEKIGKVRIAEGVPDKIVRQVIKGCLAS